VIVAQYVRGCTFLQQSTQRAHAAKTGVNVFHVASAGAKLNRGCLLFFVVCTGRSVSPSNQGKTGKKNNDSPDSQKCPAHILNHVFPFLLLAALRQTSMAASPTKYLRAARYPEFPF
jgi:hypothetical protein